MSLVRSMQIASLRFQLWLLRQMMESKMTPPAPKRRRRKKTVTEQPTPVPETVNDENGVRLDADALGFFTRDSVLDKRRRHLSSMEIAGLLGETLVRRGMPAELLAKTRFVWVAGVNGAPELFLILPGAEA